MTKVKLKEEPEQKARNCLSDLQKAELLELMKQKYHDCCKWGAKKEKVAKDLSEILGFTVTPSNIDGVVRNIFELPEWLAPWDGLLGFERRAMAKRVAALPAPAASPVASPAANGQNNGIDAFAASLPDIGNQRIHLQDTLDELGKLCLKNARLAGVVDKEENKEAKAVIENYIAESQERKKGKKRKTPKPATSAEERKNLLLWALVRFCISIHRHYGQDDKDLPKPIVAYAKQSAELVR